MFLIAFPDVTDLFIGSSILAKTNPSFPIIFHSVQGECKKEARGFVNSDEIKVVINYIHKLLECKVDGKPLDQKNIGVVSPYRLQCDTLRGFFGVLKWNDITIGTAETYQGQERPVMVISTVRSDKTLGFVSDAQVRETENYFMKQFMKQIVTYFSFFVILEIKRYDHTG